MRQVALVCFIMCAAAAVAVPPERSTPVEVSAAHDEAGSILSDNRSSLLQTVATNPPVLSAESTAAEVLAACRSSLPARPIEMSGSLTIRNRRGIPLNKYDYWVRMDRTKNPSLLSVRIMPEGETNVLERVSITRAPGSAPKIRSINAAGEVSNPSLVGRVMDTDVTWLDLTLDFLWWSSSAFEADRELESVHGQKCVVILVAPPAPLPGVSAVRLWADRKTGCLMQAEQLNDQLNPVRRLWGTRVKKFGGKWMANVLEVETLGSGHRTKIVVDDLIEE